MLSSIFGSEYIYIYIRTQRALAVGVSDIQKGSSGAKVLNTFMEIEKADSVNGKYYDNVSIIEE